MVKKNEKGKPNSDTWCSEFYDCINEVTYVGAKKYALRDWEKPDGAVIDTRRNCDAIFHHLAREFVRQELQPLVDQVTSMTLEIMNEDNDVDLYDYVEAIQELTDAIQRDHEFGTEHMQHIAARAAMGYTRKVRGLD